MPARAGALRFGRVRANFQRPLLPNNELLHSNGAYRRRALADTINSQSAQNQNQSGPQQ